MFTMIYKRLFTAIFSLFIVGVLVFFVTESLPGDFCTSYLGQNATGSRLEQCRIDNNLNAPLVERFSLWSENVVSGNLGTSLKRQRPVSDVLVPRLENTLILGGIAALIGIPIAIFLGCIAGLRANKKSDHFISIASLFTMTVPEFVTATLLTLIFSIWLPWFPAVTLIGENASLSELLPNVVLPVVALSMAMIAHILRMVRSCMITVMNSSYIKMARLKGIPYWYIVFHHALPNALLPAINIIALTIAWLLGGVVIIEQVFNYPGIGSLMISAIYDRDLPVVQGVAIVLAIIYILVNLCADLLTCILNPKLRTQQGY
ncbi:ABC transporter permease [Desulfotalea psychrophila]|nr:ABC transporter permease [Desulfotalea psychrophila]